MPSSGRVSGSIAIRNCRDLLFGNYTRVVLISQAGDDAVVAAGREAAERLGLDFLHEPAGFEPFAVPVELSIREAVA